MTLDESIGMISIAIRLGYKWNHDNWKDCLGDTTYYFTDDFFDGRTILYGTKGSFRKYGHKIIKFKDFMDEVIKHGKLSGGRKGYV